MRAKLFGLWMKLDGCFLRALTGHTQRSDKSLKVGYRLEREGFGALTLEEGKAFCEFLVVNYAHIEILVASFRRYLFPFWPVGIAFKWMLRRELDSALRRYGCEDLLAKTRVNYAAWMRQADLRAVK